MERNPTEAVVDYLRHVRAHRLEDAMACLDEAFELEFAGTGFAMSRAQVRQAMEWDIGTNGRLEWTVEGEDERTVVVVGQEANDFLELVGIGGLPFRAVYEVEHGQVVRQVHQTDWGGESLDEALAPAVAWASAHEPEELAEIYPQGKIEYTRAGAVRWVALLRRWRAATSASKE